MNIWHLAQMIAVRFVAVANPTPAAYHQTRALTGAFLHLLDTVPMTCLILYHKHYQCSRERPETETCFGSTALKIYLVGFSVGVSYRPVQITMKAVAEAEIV